MAYRKAQRRFTANLRQIREKHGLTQEQAAERCKMTMQQFQRIESGKANVTLLTLSRVADCLDVDLSELFRKPKPK